VIKRTAKETSYLTVWNATRKTQPKWTRPTLESIWWTVNTNFYLCVRL